MKTKRAQGRKGRDVLCFFKMTLKIFLKTKRAQRAQRAQYFELFENDVKNIFAVIERKRAQSIEKGRDMAQLKNHCALTQIIVLSIIFS